MPAVGLERISKILGYTITKGDFREVSPNLPQRIAILAEANDANQATLTANVPVAVNSAQQAGVLFGFGSPVYNIMRILRPISGGVIGGIPTIVYAQASAVGGAARAQTITVTGTATANGTHTLVIAGRRNVDGNNYEVNILTGDTPTVIAGKISDAINSVLGSPVSSTAAVGVVTATTKWKGLTSQGVSITVDTSNQNLGVTYAVAETVAGSGTPSVAAALQNFGSEWNTIVINGYGTVESVMQALEQYNGRPDPESPTGQYNGEIMRPFIALTGSVEADPSAITDTTARKEEVTIAICPAPLSAGLPMEAAANTAALFARCGQDTPHLDVSGKYYPDMPTPLVIGAMSNYNTRDVIVKKGCSTVELNSGRYKVVDFVTSYHPVGEDPPQYRYCRNLMLDFNVKFGYYLLQEINVVDHVIAADNDIVSASKVVKPKQWKAIVSNYANELANRGLIADVPFMQESVRVNIGTTNPDRLDTFFRYKRTGVARIASTTAEAGFNFGAVNS